MNTTFKPRQIDLIYWTTFHTFKCDINKSITVNKKKKKGFHELIYLKKRYQENFKETTFTFSP